MAYKFQLGTAKLSGSIEQTDGSLIKANTSFEIGAASINETDLEKIDGITDGTAAANKALVADSNVDISGLRNVTATGEISMTTLDIGGTNVTSTAAELNLVDGSSAGTVVNSKAVIYGASGQVNGTTFQLGGTQIIDGSGNAALGNVEVDGYVSASSYVSASALDIENNAQIGGNIDSSGDLTVATITMTGFSVDADGDTALKSLAVDNGSTIGTDSDTDMITLTNGSDIALANDLDFNIAKAGGLQLAGVAVTSTAAELNLLDTAVANTVVNSKAVIYGSSGEVKIGSLVGSAGNDLITSAGNLEINSIEFDGNIDVASAGGFSLGASMGANTMTLGGSTSTVRVAGDLEVVGTLNRVTETELLIEDKTVIVASGSADAAGAAGAGLVVDIASGDMTWLYRANGENVGGVDASASGDIFVASGSAGLIDIQAAAFYGDGSNLSGVAADSVSYAVASKADGDSLEEDKYNYFADLDGSGNSATVTLPASAAGLVGKSIFIKAKDLLNGATITINTQASAQKIDGADSIILESPYAAVRLVYVATNDWRVF